MKFKNALLGVVAAATLAFVPGSLIAQGPPPPGYRNGPGARQNWENAPSGYRDLQRQAFREGIDGARKDFGNHRRPDAMYQFLHLIIHPLKASGRFSSGGSRGG